MYDLLSSRSSTSCDSTASEAPDRRTIRASLNSAAAWMSDGRRRNEYAVSLILAERGERWRECDLGLSSSSSEPSLKRRRIMLRAGLPSLKIEA